MTIKIDNDTYSCETAQVNFFSDGAKTIDFSMINVSLPEITELMSQYTNSTIIIDEEDVFNNFKFSTATKRYDKGAPHEIHVTFINAL